MVESIGNHIRGKRYREAIAECNELLDRNPNDPELLYLLAVAQFFREDYEEAASTLQSALKADPSNVDALLLLALISSWGYGTGYDTAPDLYRRVLRLNENNVDASIGLAGTRGLPGAQMTIQESIQLLEHALVLDPDRRVTHSNLAYAYWESGEFKIAQKHFEKLLEISDPEVRPVINEKLQQVLDNRMPENLVYLGPALPRLP